MNILVVIGSTRTERFADRPAAWVLERLRREPGVDVEVLDVRDHPLPPFDGPSPMRTPRTYAWPALAAVGRMIDRADGFVVLVPEYNHGYPAGLKNVFDWTYVEWNRKPVTFVGWGQVGGARAVEQLRGVAVEMELAPLRHAVHIPGERVMYARQNPAVSAAELLAPLDERLDVLVADLRWWVDALSAARAAG